MMSKINETTQYIQERIPYIPEIAIILGSGLGPLASQVENPVILDYKDIPHFPEPTVDSHAGQLVIGTIKNQKVFIMNGRFHYYEGHDITISSLPIRVFKKLGVKHLIITNAAGGISENLNPGDLAIIEDHIGLFAPSILRGPNLDEFGPRFKDMSEVYSKKLRNLAIKTANELDIELKQGVYCFFQGPMYETPAEIRMLKMCGANMVGMSTVPEAIVANHCGISTLGISLITNKAAGLSSNQLSHEEVMETATIAGKNLVLLISTIIQNIND